MATKAHSMRNIVDYDYTLPLADSPELAAALEGAEPHTLLMVYVHLTHDEELLDRFKAHIRHPFAAPGHQWPAEAYAELREKLRKVLTTPGAAKEGSPPRALMQKMMSIGVGEEVADEFVPMMIEQGGFERTPDRTKVPGRAPVPAGFKVLIIGGGLTGLL
ncbi:MAG: hypothetical protein PHE36_11060, partial [Novosphingobium sp.]|nr:hypothetical protein [Novosphingobium sp.]